jgi:SAM-dependent methyltransferase
MYIHETNIHNTKAAKEVVPIIIKQFSPTSVLDVGCGIGTWLSVFEECGVSKIMGLDGDYVNPEQIFSNIQEQQFLACNLTKSFDLKEKFDLLICFEVAEHLPEKSAKGFISSLCTQSDLILFGAAIPGQWGQNHLNEQWVEYWIELFHENGFSVADTIRPNIWHNKNVEWWYKQNILVFRKADFIELNDQPLFNSVIHPEHFCQKVKYIQDQDEKLYFIKNELSNWQNGNMGVRKHWATFITSLTKKLFGN